MSTYGFSELTCTKLYPKYLAFRHQVFNEILKYNETGNPVYHFQAFDIAEQQRDFSSPVETSEFGVEYDNYDVPKALHLAYTQDSGHSHYSVNADSHGKIDQQTTVLGCLRFLPTDGPYMIKDNITQGIWKNVELLDELPSQHNIYEASRIAVSPALEHKNPLREVILDNLVYANVELAVRLGINKMVGIMYDRVWQSVYVKRGVPIKYLSKPFFVDDGQPIIIGEITTTPDILAHLNQRYAFHLARRIIMPPVVESGTWLMHYYHVNKMVPLSISSQLNTLEMRHALAGRA